MQASKHPNFNAQFPEAFNWNLLESERLSTLAQELSKKVWASLKTAERLETPGLHSALVSLAFLAEVLDFHAEERGRSLRK